MKPRTLNVARLGVVDYAAALELQTALAAARMRDEIGDTAPAARASARSLPSAAAPMNAFS